MHGLPEEEEEVCTLRFNFADGVYTRPRDSIENKLSLNI